MFKRPLVTIAIAYAVLIIILRPWIPSPPQKPYPQEKNEIPVISAINAHFMLVIQKTTPAPYDALLGSVVFGTSVSPLDQDLKESYKKVGLAHLLVASGTQVSILIGVCLMLIRIFRVPVGWGVITASFLNILFALMTGCGPSILRAAIMGEVTLLGLLFNREGEIYTSLSLAALILMIVDPLIIFDIGFQLSFTATWALVYLAPVLEKKIPPLLAISAAPILATTPITLYNFNQLSPSALLVNTIVMPWVEILTVLGFASTALGAIFLPVAAVLNGTLLLILKLFNEIVYTFSAIPGACLYLPAPPLLVIGLYYAILIAMVEGRLKKEYLFRIGLALAVIGLWAALFSPLLAAKELVVSVIDVGQGDSILVQSPSGKTLLIDGGPKYKRSDAGRRFVLPYLHKKGINKIDILVLTHPHDDHVGGLPSVIKDMPVGLVFDSGQIHTSQSYLDFLKLIYDKKIPYKVAREGQELDLGGGVLGQIINPSESFIEDSALNNNSVVIRLIYKDATVLLAGDLEKAGEERILGMGWDIKSSILKVGHHGSRTSSSLEFLQKVRPKVALISAGAKNKFHHPHPSTLARLGDLGIRVFRTDLSGTVTIRSDGEKYTIETQK